MGRIKAKRGPKRKRKLTHEEIIRAHKRKMRKKGLV